MADYSIVQEAVRRGYSMDEIADKLASDAGYAPALLRERGYDSNAILLKLGYLAPKPDEIGAGSSAKLLAAPPPPPPESLPPLKERPVQRYPTTPAGMAQKAADEARSAKDAKEAARLALQFKLKADRGKLHKGDVAFANDALRAEKMHKGTLTAKQIAQAQQVIRGY